MRPVEDRSIARRGTVLPSEPARSVRLYPGATCARLSRSPMLGVGRCCRKRRKGTDQRDDLVVLVEECIGAKARRVVPIRLGSVICQHEYKRSRLLRCHRFHDLEPATFGKPNVNNGDIWLGSYHVPNRRCGSAGVSDHLGRRFPHKIVKKPRHDGRIFNQVNTEGMGAHFCRPTP